MSESQICALKIVQEIRSGDADLIRALFERATSLSLPAKKMKVLSYYFLTHCTCVISVHTSWFSNILYVFVVLVQEVPQL